jgi:hypothetical protein
MPHNKCIIVWGDDSTERAPLANLMINKLYDASNVLDAGRMWKLNPNNAISMDNMGNAAPLDLNQNSFISGYFSLRGITPDDTVNMVRASPAQAQDTHVSAGINLMTIEGFRGEPLGTAIIVRAHDNPFALDPVLVEQRLQAYNEWAVTLIQNGQLMDSKALDSDKRVEYTGAIARRNLPVALLSTGDDVGDIRALIRSHGLDNFGAFESYDFVTGCINANR